MWAGSVCGQQDSEVAHHDFLAQTLRARPSLPAAFFVFMVSSQTDKVRTLASLTGRILGPSLELGPPSCSLHRHTMHSTVGESHE